VLFKRFADIDVFDIELDIEEVDPFCEAVKAMEPTFGGVNLEDIKAPECFKIDRATPRGDGRARVPRRPARDRAIISGAALMNATEISGKDLSEIDIVFSGAGASAIASARFYVSLGAKKENITMCDSSGIITEERVANGGVNEYKSQFASDVEGVTSPTRWRTRTCSLGSLSAESSLRRWSDRWRRIRSSSRWRTPIRRSPTRTRKAPATTR